jgi:hypothetical protein
MGYEFTCPKCGMTSHNPKDAELGYCGNCNDFTRKTLTVKLCLATHCQEPIAKRTVLCEQHWSMLPKDLQKEFYRSRYKFEQGFEGGEILIGETITRILEAIDDRR